VFGKVSVRRKVCAEHQPGRHAVAEAESCVPQKRLKVLAHARNTLMLDGPTAEIHVKAADCASVYPAFARCAVFGEPARKVIAPGRRIVGGYSGHRMGFFHCGPILAYPPLGHLQKCAHLIPSLCDKNDICDEWPPSAYPLVALVASVAVHISVERPAVASIFRSAIPIAASPLSACPMRSAEA